MTPQISVFSDCDSRCLVMRVPYEYACQMIAATAKCDEKAELIKWMRRQKSPYLKETMKEYHIE